ncbi:prepilin-type N-terminal cleavage/methylation domain-containing protein [Macrococcus animalis]
MFSTINNKLNSLVQSFKQQFKKRDGFTLIEMIIVTKTLNTL